MRSAALALLGLFIVAVPAAAQTAPVAKAPATPPACPYTAAELSAALGIDVNEGAASAALPFSGGTMLSCRYTPKRFDGPSFILNQTVMNDPAQANPDTYFKQMAGRMQPVPNDPDKALWQGDQGDLTNATLHYARKSTIVEARVTVGPKHPQFQAIKEKLAKLRRVP